MTEPLPRLADETYSRVLCVAAHPDDLEYGVAGAVATWTARGVAVRYLMATHGEAGIDTMEPADARLARADDERTAAAATGAEGVDFLDCADGVVEYGLALRRQIAAAIRRFRPDAVVVGAWDVASPWGLNQADHRAVGLATLDAIRDAGNRWVFRDLADDGLGEPWSTRWLLVAGDNAPNAGVVLDADALDRGIASMQAHATYLAALTAHPPAADTVRGFTAMMGRAMGVPHASLFRVWDMGGPVSFDE